MLKQLMVPLLAALALGCTTPQETRQEKQAGISELIRKLGADDADVRTRATEELLLRWKQWSEKDIEKLSEATNSSDPEFRLRSKQALGTIRAFQSIEKMLGMIKGSESAILRGGKEDRLRMLREARQLWTKGDLTDEDLRGLPPMATHYEWGLEGMSLLKAIGRVRPFAQLAVPCLKDKDHDVREQATRQLGRMGASEYAGMIVPLLEDDHEFVRANVLDALKQMNAKNQAKKIVPFLKHRNGKVRAAAIYALALIGAPEHGEKLLPLLRDRDAEVRSRAADSLGRMGATEYADKIVPLLEDSEAQVREGAARGLGQMAATDYVDRVIPLLRDPATQAKLAASTALERMLAAMEPDMIIPFLEHEWIDVRAEAVRALGVVGEKGHIEKIRPFLSHRSSRLRSATLYALAGLGGKNHIEIVLPLLKDRQSRVQQAAIYALGQLGTSEHAKSIVPLLKHREHYVKLSAMQAIGEIGALEHARDLLPFLDDSDLRFDTTLALINMYEKEGYRNLTTEVTLQRPIGSLLDLKQMLERVGLRLDVEQTPIPRSFPHQWPSTTPRSVLDDMYTQHTEMVLTLERDEVRIVKPKVAKSYWSKRIAKD